MSTRPSGVRSAGRSDLSDLVAQSGSAVHHRTASFDGTTIVCDCGDRFDYAVDLEHHQSAFLHPMPGRQ